MGRKRQEEEEEKEEEEASLRWERKNFHAREKAAVRNAKEGGESAAGARRYRARGDRRGDGRLGLGLGRSRRHRCSCEEGARARWPR